MVDASNTSLAAIRRRALLVVMVAAACLVGSRSARADDPYTNRKTYTYKTVVDLPIRADVYRLPGDDVRPVIVFIHGGGLITGGRGGPALEQRKRYLDAGYVIVSIDYRLAPETKLAGIIEDVRDSITWVRARGPELFKIDPKRLAVIGHSAGGYLTLVAGYAVEPRPQALIAFYGYGDVDGDWYSKPSEFHLKTRPLVSKEQAYQAIGAKETTNSTKGRSDFYTYCRQNGLWTREVGGYDPVTQPREFDRFCPIRNMSEDYPPTILLHGDKDTDVPHEQSVKLAAELKRLGVVHEFISVPGGNHGFDARGMTDPAVSAAFAKIEAFLKEHVGKEAGREDADESCHGAAPPPAGAGDSDPARPERLGTTRPDLRIDWAKNMLTIRGGFPGEVIRVNYLEAYCRPGSTDRDWNQTVIGHTTELLSATEDERRVRLRCKLTDGVIVEHDIVSLGDEIDFRIRATNPTEKESQAHWAQPCIRLDAFTGCAPRTDEYLPKSFVFLDGKPARMPTKSWAKKARYTPGQVWAPKHVNRDDVNPRPLSELVPSNGLIGCYSSDETWLFATAFEPYQELFQGVITCLHSDFRIGGLKPGETKQVRGKIYVVPADMERLLSRYRTDFPEHEGP